MKAIHTAVLAAAVAGLVACRDRAPEPTATAGTGASIEKSVGDNVGRAMAEAKRKLETENITIRTDSGQTRKAEITPAGDLLIDGKAVAIDADQRRLLLDHREQIISIAGAGMDVGVQGARLATKAMTEALTGIFSGDPDRIEQRIEAQSQDVKAAARKLCERLPAMHASQRRLAAAIPEFAPFAKGDISDVKDCEKELEDEPAAPEAPAAPEPPASATPASTA